VRTLIATLKRRYRKRGRVSAWSARECASFDGKRNIGNSLVNAVRKIYGLRKATLIIRSEPMWNQRSQSKQCERC
jgi:hypothetical protein